MFFILIFLILLKNIFIPYKMEKILSDLSIKDINDYNTIIDKYAFEKLNIEHIRLALNQFNMSDKNLIDTEESKFEHVNLILMFKFEKVIDSIKILDGASLDLEGVALEGFRLEPMP